MKPSALAVLVLTVLGCPAAWSAARVSSNSDCPSSAAISLRLLGLLAAGGPARAYARVEVDGGAMRIEVSTPGEQIQQRSVPITGDCDSRAEMAALVIASWLDAMPVGTLDAPGIPPRDVPRLDGRDSDSDSSSEPEEARLVLDMRTLLGVGAYGVTDADGASAGLSLDVGMPNLLDVFGWLAQLHLGWPRERAVGQGIAHTWRPSLGLAATGEIVSGAWTARGHLGAELAVLTVSGSGYAHDRSAITSLWGGYVGATLGRAWKQRELWLRVEAVVWPQERSIRSSQVPSGPDIVVALPTWELRAGLGLAWGLR
jgi:hypothetical protein